MTWNHQSRTSHRGVHCVKPRCYSSNPTESTNCRRRDRNVKQAWDRQLAASLASHVAAPALLELVSFHTAEHIRDEIRRIDGSVHHHHHLLCCWLRWIRWIRWIIYLLCSWRTSHCISWRSFISFSSDGREVRLCCVNKCRFLFTESVINNDPVSCSVFTW